MITSEDLSKLRERLPHGYAPILEKRTGFSRSSIYSVLTGDRYVQDVIDAAITLANETDQAKQRAKDEISKLA